MLDTTTTAIRHDGARLRPMFRIAVPAWAPSGRKPKDADEADRAPCREDFKRMLDAALDSNERMHRRMTRRERQQIAVTQKLRQALYGNRIVS